ncbi:COX15/CtaA family protein [Arenibacter sp. GZD96]|uniref:COX15/CtaA family protein n=1 Tax=Aurantibrevibacter litoralis TaxID=3106030 RepID=UPI002AFE9FC1|nr:COX15/CtaA family protein [Arenibacter sp. GZD-96]MEA1787120.1 COX15/CtaA family protein [Arenibacter sp. GZD-96]
MEKRFRNIAKVALVLVYLVIVAGAVVRMTGSGMGCPDWPKCFGYYIPPTHASELEWKPTHTYRSGQVIIRDETLQVAKTDFTTETAFDTKNWEPYTKHDYAVFNPAHTWTEFINRLFGALAGLGTLVLALYSLTFWKKQKVVTLVSWVVVLAMGFQAWLGATVVYSVLEPVKISVHMVMALVIVALLLFLIHKTKNRDTPLPYDPLTVRLLFVALAFSLFQIIVGTQVRQFVDVQTDLFGESNKHLWLQNPNVQFYVHRSFSILVVLLNLFLAYRITKKNLGYDKIRWVLLLLFLEVISGMGMYYLHFPFSSQPLHLVFAAVLFGLQFYLILEPIKSATSPKTL